MNTAADVSIDQFDKEGESDSLSECLLNLIGTYKMN